MEHLFEAFLVFDPEALLFIDDSYSEIFINDILRNKPMGADDHVH